MPLTQIRAWQLPLALAFLSEQQFPTSTQVNSIKSKKSVVVNEDLKTIIKSKVRNSYNVFWEFSFRDMIVFKKKVKNNKMKLLLNLTNIMPCCHAVVSAHVMCSYLIHYPWRCYHYSKGQWNVGGHTNIFGILQHIIFLQLSPITQR